MKIVYAGFWRRLVAFGIDLVILWVIQGIVFFGVTWNVIFIFGVLAEKDISFFSNGEIYWSTAFTSNIIINFVLIWLYFALFESSSMQATPGKALVKIIVTDLYGKRISFGRASSRYWGKLLSALILMFGFIQTAFSRRKQAFHDFLANCLVYKKRQRKEYILFKCKNCQKEAKVLKGRGAIKVQCPNCLKIYMIKT